MHSLYDSLFVNPSLEAVVPIFGSLLAGTIMSFFKRLMKIGVTILLIGVAALVLYLVVDSGMLGQFLGGMR